MKNNINLNEKMIFQILNKITEYNNNISSLINVLKNIIETSTYESSNKASTIASNEVRPITVQANEENATASKEIASIAVISNVSTKKQKDYEGIYTKLIQKLEKVNDVEELKEKGQKLIKYLEANPYPLSYIYEAIDKINQFEEKLKSQERIKRSTIVQNDETLVSIQPKVENATACEEMASTSVVRDDDEVQESIYFKKLKEDVNNIEKIEDFSKITKKIEMLRNLISTDEYAELGELMENESKCYSYFMV